jgi:5'-phosphate synthase pdxT subunit
MRKLMADYRFVDTVKEFAAAGKPVFGTCAGLIVMADRVGGRRQDLLNLIDVDVERNAYGRQVDSFSGPVAAPALGGPFDAVFIRAPRIRRVGRGVEVVATGPGREPVAVRSGRVAGLAFHPELTPDPRFHRWFLAEVAGLRLPGKGGRP